MAEWGSISTCPVASSTSANGFSAVEEPLIQPLAHLEQTFAPVFGMIVCGLPVTALAASLVTRT